MSDLTDCNAADMCIKKLCQTWQIFQDAGFRRQWISQIGKGQMTYSLFWDYTYICKKLPTFRDNLTTVWKSSKWTFIYAVRFMEHEVWQQTLRIPVFWLCVAWGSDSGSFEVMCSLHLQGYHTWWWRWSDSSRCREALSQWHSVALQRTGIISAPLR